MVITDLLLDELSERCREETAKFYRNVASDARYCYELLRRALFENHSDAFTRVY